MRWATSAEFQHLDYNHLHLLLRSAKSHKEINWVRNKYYMECEVKHTKRVDVTRLGNGLRRECKTKNKKATTTLTKFILREIFICSSYWVLFALKYMEKLPTSPISQKHHNLCVLIRRNTCTQDLLPAASQLEHKF